MQINSIQIYNARLQQHKSHNIQNKGICRHSHLAKPLQSDKIFLKNDCFTSFGNKHPLTLTLFKHEFNKAYKNSNIGGILYKNITPNNFLGQGRLSICYQIPKIDNFVLIFPNKQILTQEHLSSATLSEVVDDFDGRNFGQPIAKLGDNIMISKRVHGEPNSIPYWYNYLFNTDAVTSEHAKDFLEKLSKIAKLKQNEYNSYAESLNYLNSKDVKCDTINPNNVLLDFKKNKIGLVDVQKSPYFNNLKNTHHDMISGFLDMGLFTSFYNKLDTKNKNKLIHASKDIIEKCNESNSILKMDNSKEEYLKYLSITDKFFIDITKGTDVIKFIPITQRYQEMMNILSHKF